MIQKFLKLFNKHNREAEEKERILVLQRLSRTISKKEMDMVEKLRLFQDESGMTATEYVIMVTMIAMAIVVAVGLFGVSVNGLFEKVLAALKIAG